MVGGFCAKCQEQTAQWLKDNRPAFFKEDKQLSYEERLAQNGYVWDEREKRHVKVPAALQA